MFQKLNKWERNRIVYIFDSLFNWFFIPVGVWIVIWSNHLSFTQISLSTGISLIAGLLFELPSGVLSDLIGHKKTVIIGRLILFLGYLQLFFNHNFLGFVVFQICYQLGESFNSGAQSALMYDSIIEDKVDLSEYKKLESLTYTLCTLGMVISSILGGYLYLVEEFLPYTAMIFVSGFGFLLSTLYIQPNRYSHNDLTVSGYIKQTKEGIVNIFENKIITLISIFSIVINFVGYLGVWYLYEPRLNAGGWDSKTLAFLVSGTYLIRALASASISKFEKKFGEEKSAIFISLTQVVGSLLSFIKTPTGSILSVYTRKFSDGFRWPVLLNLQNKNIASKNRATSLSAISLIGNIFIGGTGLFLGVFIDKYGIENVFAFTGFLSLFFALPISIKLKNISIVDKNSKD